MLPAADGQVVLAQRDGARANRAVAVDAGQRYANPRAGAFAGTAR